MVGLNTDAICRVTKRLADFFANEEEDRVRLTEQEREELAKHEHTFDFQLGEEHIKFLEDNGYLVIEVRLLTFLNSSSYQFGCEKSLFMNRLLELLPNIVMLLY
jgi:hypothetical protein